MGLQVDPEFKVVHTDIVQLKVLAMKTVAFCAGYNRHICFFLHFFDYLVHGPRLPAYVPGTTTSICRDWERTAAPSTAP